MSRIRNRIVSRRSARLRERGISTITAIFLITLMAGLAAAATTLLRTARDSSTLDMQAQRARQAALAGLEWGKVTLPTCAVSTDLPAASMPATLSPYTVTVMCIDDGAYTDVSPNVHAYRLAAVACNEPVPGPGGTCPNNASTTGRYVEAVATTNWPQ